MVAIKYSPSVEKFLPYPKGDKAAPAKDFTPPPQQNEDSKALCALSNYARPMVRKPNFISDTDLERVKDTFIAGLLDDEGLLPDDRTLSYIVSYMFDLNADDLGYELYNLGTICRRFGQFSKEEKDKIFNSGFLSLVKDTVQDKHFKSGALEVPFDKMEEYNRMTRNALTRHALSSCLSCLQNEEHGIEPKLDTEKIDDTMAPICAFAKKPYAEAFSDLLMKRNCADIKILSKELPAFIEAEDDTKELHSLLKTLLEATNPKGEYIFGSGEAASDKVSEVCLQGLFNILNARKNDPQKFKILMQVLDMTKNGEVPTFVLGISAKEGEINQDWLDTVLGKNSAPCAAESNRAVYDSGEGKIPLKMSLETFNKLFPEKELLALSQGRLGDCYLVSAIYDFMKNPVARGKIFEMFEEKGDNIVVTLPDAKDSPISFPKDKIELEGKRNVNAPLGIQMLELAYSKTRSAKFGSADKLTAIEGGAQCFVYNAFLGKNASKSYRIGDDFKMPTSDEIEDVRKAYEKEIEEQKARIKNLQDSDAFFAHLDYLHDRENIEKLQDLEACQRAFFESIDYLSKIENATPEKLLDTLVQNASDPHCIISLGTKADVFDKDKMIYGGHAYSVLGVDEENKTVKVVNPWNTAQYVTLSYEEFKDYFSSLEIARVS